MDQGIALNGAANGDVSTLWDYHGHYDISGSDWSKLTWQAQSSGVVHIGIQIDDGHNDSSYVEETITIASPSVTAFAAQQAASAAGVGGVNGFAIGSTGGASVNGVIGWQDWSFTTGHDAVVLDAPRSSYAVQVNGSGVATIKDIGVGDANFGQSVTVSGASYLIFNGGSSTTVAGLPVYDQIYFIETPANAQLAQFFAAATQFKSAIALAGLEYWENQLAGGMSLTAIAQSFLNTSYFQTTYGDPGTSHAQHVSYVEALYKNILGMTLDANNGGVAYWAGQMDNGSLSGAATLISFTNATAGTSTINAVSGATAGSGGGWLINPSVTGGYADPGLQLPAQTVLSQGAAANFYDLSLIDPTTLGSVGVSANGVTLTPALLTLSTTAPASSITLSSSITQLVAANSGDFVHDGPGSDGITITGSGNVLTLGSATTDLLNLGNANGSYVFGFAPGHGSVLAASGTANGMAATLLNGTTTVVQGSAFGTAASSSPIYVNIGNVGGNSAAEVAAAANKAYLVAGGGGNAATGALGEHVMFLGTDTGGNAEVWAFRGSLSPVTVNGHTVQAPIAGADLNGNHLVDANEITLIATLIGVPAANLAAADLA